MATKRKAKKKAKAKVSRVSNQPCGTEGCENAAYYVGTLLCHACYQYMWGWSKRSIKDRVTRRRKLKVYQERLDTLG